MLLDKPADQVYFHGFSHHVSNRRFGDSAINGSSLKECAQFSRPLRPPEQSVLDPEFRIPLVIDQAKGFQPIQDPSDGGLGVSPLFKLTGQRKRSLFRPANKP
jgi:hypothetical protein